MDRIHFFEIEDQSWCPGIIRDSATTFLQWFANSSKVFDTIAPILVDVLQKLGHNKIVDLCSGGGGPWLTLAKKLKHLGVSPEITLTDLYPNQAGINEVAKNYAGSIRYLDSSVNGLDVPEKLRGCRTLFNGFHHFKPWQARALLQDAVNKKQGIAIFDFTHKRFIGVVSVMPGFFVSALSSPFWRPFRWHHVFWSLVLPVVPLLVLFDGVVSALRVYGPDELKKLIAGVEGEESFHWEVGSVMSETVPFAITYLVAYPKKP